MCETPHLPIAARELWNAYLDLERQKVRSEMLPALDEFVASVISLPSEQWHAWALDVARRVVDEGEDIAVRVPLFRTVLFPALYAGLVDAHPGCARWLAGLSQLLYKSPTCREQLPEHLRTQAGLLREALAQNPDDARAREELIRVLASQLDYAIHEVPSGVLWGSNGANIEQCAQLRVELDEFCRLVAVECVQDEYEDLIVECRLHFSAYPDYLSRRSEYASYAEYLQRQQET